MDAAAPPLSIYIRSLRSGLGAERIAVTLARGFAECGRVVDLLVEDEEGALLDEVRGAPGDLRVVNLRTPINFAERRGAQARGFLGLVGQPRNGSRSRKAVALRRFFQLIRKDDPPVAALARYAAVRRPGVIMALLDYPALTLMLAAPLLRPRVKLVVNIRNHVSSAARAEGSKWRRSVPAMMRASFGFADGVIAISSGVATDLANVAGVPSDRISVVSNPAFRPDAERLAQKPLDDPWFAEGAPPVILGVGKLKPQKNFTLLLEAFARIRARRRARLVILGEGPERAALRARAVALGVDEDVDLRGYVENPYPYYRGAAVFVLSSLWEGFGNVLVEAMACGCPSVATDCPSGPFEITAGGRFGRLVPSNDPEAMALAIEQTLEEEARRGHLITRASTYSVQASVKRYLQVLEDIARATSP